MLALALEHPHGHKPASSAASAPSRTFGLAAASHAPGGARVSSHSSLGLAVTAVLQSSTATGLMATSFAARGAIDLGPALAVMLGANLGSTLITQVLAFDIAAVAPIFVLIGVVVFRSSGDGQAKNLGRVAIASG